MDELGNGEVQVRGSKCPPQLANPLFALCCLYWNGFDYLGWTPNCTLELSECICSVSNLDIEMTFAAVGKKFQNVIKKKLLLEYNFSCFLFSPSKPTSIPYFSLYYSWWVRFANTSLCFKAILPEAERTRPFPGLYPHLSASWCSRWDFGDGHRQLASVAPLALSVSCPFLLFPESE